MLFGKYASQKSEAKYPALRGLLQGAFVPSIQSASGLSVYDLSAKQQLGSFNGLTEAAWTRTKGRNSLLFPNSPARFDSNVTIPAGPFSVSFYDCVTTSTTLQARVQFKTIFTYPWAFIRVNLGGYDPVTFGPWQGANGVRATSAPTIASSVGVWQHWLIVGQSANSNTPSDYRVFVDGVEYSTSASSLMSSTTNTTRIGTNPFSQDANCSLDAIYLFSGDVSRFAKLLATDPIAPVRAKRQVFGGTTSNRRRRLLLGASS
jgi:hypothetical protein